MDLRIHSLSGQQGSTTWHESQNPDERVINKKVMERNNDGHSSVGARRPYTQLAG